MGNTPRVMGASHTTRHHFFMASCPHCDFRVCIIKSGLYVCPKCHTGLHLRHTIIMKYRNRIPDEIRRAVMEKYGYQCAYCKSTTNLEIDHIHPHHATGDDGPDNLQVLCKRCNTRKGGRGNEYLDSRFDHTRGIYWNELLARYPTAALARLTGLSAYRIKKFKQGASVNDNQRSLLYNALNMLETRVNGDAEVRAFLQDIYYND